VNQRYKSMAAGVFAVASCFCLRSGVYLASAQQAVPSESTQQTFIARCSTCHAEHGEGSEVGASLNVPDLRSPRIQKLDDATLRQIIKDGRGDMPKFRRDFSEEEINRLIQLVRSFAQRIEEAKMASSPANPGREN